MYGYADAHAIGSPLLENDPVALSGTMSTATIFNGTTLDNSQFAYAGGDVTKTALDAEINGAGNTVSTSIQPVFITQKDINFAPTKGISNKIFSHIGYTCADVDSCYSPYFGIGFEVEFGQGQGNHCDDECDNNNNDCNNNCNDDCEDDQNCNDCVKCALSQWGIWAKFGVAFSS